MEILALKSALLKKGVDLIKAIQVSFKQNKVKLCESDILVVSSKVVALSEGRVFELQKVNMRFARVHRNLKNFDGKAVDPCFASLVASEADYVIPRSLLTTVKNGIIIPAAGLDYSNSAPGFVIGWPKNPQASARKLWKVLKRKFGLRRLGVLICDSHCQPLRWGATGLGLAWAGFNGIEDIRGQRDLYGKPLRFTRKAVADNLASAALLLMGEAAERIPFVIIRNAPVQFTDRFERVSKAFVPPEKCLFGAIYNRQFVHALKK